MGRVTADVGRAELADQAIDTPRASTPARAAWRGRGNVVEMINNRDGAAQMLRCTQPVSIRTLSR